MRSPARFPGWAPAEEACGFRIRMPIYGLFRKELRKKSPLIPIKCTVISGLKSRASTKFPRQLPIDFLIQLSDARLD